MHIAIDVMGGDSGPEVIIPSALRCANDHPDLKLTMVGNQSQLEQILSTYTYDENRMHVSHAEDVVNMDEKPAIALRKKKQSSMHLALNLVKSGEADACVSSGNTGALMAIGRHILKTLPGIDRPAIIKAMPTENGRCYLLDLGANINCDAENLVQFAAMGSLMCESVENIKMPKVGLLNIGEEEIKGSIQVKLAAELLKNNPLVNYIGYIEGDGIYKGSADVVVCDGWVGNIALKTSEGLARFVSQIITQAFDSSLMSKAAGFVASPVLEKLRDRLNPQLYNGASLLGLNGIVVKSHGHADDAGFYNALLESMRMIDSNVPGLISDRIEDMMFGFQ